MSKREWTSLAQKWAYEAAGERVVGLPPENDDEPLTENQLQAKVVKALRKMGLFVVAIPNGGKRNKRTGWHMKNTGVIAGFPDIQVMRPGKRVDLLELKLEDGKLSDKQFALHSKLTSMGFAVHVVRSVDEAVKVFA